MKVRVRHATTYRYDERVAICHNEVRLTPRTFERQTALRTQLLIDPTPSTLTQHQDYFGNTVHYFTLEASHAAMTVTAVSDVTVVRAAAPDPATSAPWETVRDRLATDRRPDVLDAYQFVFESPHVQFGPEVVAYAAPSFPPGRPLLEGAADLTRRIHADFTYAPGATSIATEVAEVLRERRGVCQDFTHLELACLRAMGLAARYVSGYILTGRTAEERIVGADASHAWVSVYDPDHDWVDLDPTNDQVPAAQHVTVAWGRDFSDVSPVKGVILGGGAHSVEVGVDVAPAG